MQCSSYIPVYYHSGDLNAGASVIYWHPFDSNNCGEERGYNIDIARNSVDRYLGYDKEVLKQKIQNHETTFRFQVQELHRLYRRQKELMDEMRVREIFTQHLLSQSSESFHSLSRNTQRPSNSISENNYNDVKFQSSSSKGNANRNLDLELAADLSRSALTNRSTNCFIDLNEPLELESMPSSSSGPSETSHMEIDLNSMPVSCLFEIEMAQENLLKNEEPVEDHPKFLKTETKIDLNMGIEDEEHSPRLSTSVLQIKSEEGTEMVGEKSEDIQVETPLSSEQGEREPSIQLDTIAAQTLVMISSQEYDSRNSLLWFAEIVSSIGYDLEKEIMELENTLNFSHVQKMRETCTSPGKGPTRGGLFKRTTGRKACAKPRKYTLTGQMKKSTSSIFKQLDARSKWGVLQSWGQIRKRQGDRRRRDSKFVVAL